MRILLVTDKCPIPGFPDWNDWCVDHLSVVGRSHSIDVVAIVAVLPRLRNLIRLRRFLSWIRALRLLPRDLECSTNVHIRFLRVLNFPSTLSWSLLPRFLSWQCRLHQEILPTHKRYDLCLIHGAYPAGLCGVDLGARLGIPTVMVSHDGLDIYDKYFRASAKNTQIRIMQRAGSIVALSNEHADELRSYFPRIRIWTIPHVIKNDAAISPGPAENTLRIITACRLDAKEKDVSALLEAVKHLSGTCRVRLTIAGDGFELPSLRRTARRLGVEQFVRFTGWLTSAELYAELSRHDLYAHVSHFEAFGHAPALALSAGVPVVAIKSNGFLNDAPSEVIGCVVAETPTTEGLVAAMRSLSDHPSRRMKLGSSGAEYVRKHFSANRHLSDYEALFHAVVAERKQALDEHHAS